MADAYSQARSSFRLPNPPNPNFVTHVFDKFAEDPSLEAMLWVSADKPNPRVERLTYAYFQERSHRVACALYELGLRKGDRVLLMLPRIPAWWEIALGMLRLGVVMVPSTMLLVSKDIEYRLEACGARGFIASVDAASQFIQCRKYPSSLEFTILVEDYYSSSKSMPQSQHSWIPYSKLLSSVPQNIKWKGTPFKADDPSIIYFTSGTTGMPKMVQHTQISYPFGCVITGKYWLKLEPGKTYWNMSEQGWAKAAWSFFAAFVLSINLSS
jgi:medium-chain acyl-CoA synthetase